MAETETGADTTDAPTSTDGTPTRRTGKGSSTGAAVAPKADSTSSSGGRGGQPIGPQLSRFIAPLLFANGVWHSLAFWYFVVWGKPTLVEHFRLPTFDITEMTLWVMQFLGSINLGFAVLGFLSAYRVYRVTKRERRAARDGRFDLGAQFDGAAARSTDFIVLAVANASQAWLDLVVFRYGLANPSFLKVCTNASSRHRPAGRPDVLHGSY